MWMSVGNSKKALVGGRLYFQIRVYYIPFHGIKSLLQFSSEIAKGNYIRA